MKRRIFSLILCVALLAAIFPTAVLAAPDGDYTLVLYEGGLYKNTVAPGNRITNSAISCEVDRDGGYIYTFTDLHWSTSAPCALLIEDDAATVRLAGTNVLQSGSSSENTYGLKAYSDLKIVGSGSLDVTAGDSTGTTGSSYGIFIGAFCTVTVAEATVTATSGVAVNGWGAFLNYSDLILESGTMNLTGKGSDSSTGMNIDSLYVNGGTLNAVVGEGKHTYGILAADAMEINGGTVNAVGGEYGLYNPNSGLLMTGGSLTLSGTTLATNQTISTWMADYAMVSAGDSASSARELTDWVGEGDDSTAYKYLNIECTTDSIGSLDDLRSYTVALYQGKGYACKGLEEKGIPQNLLTQLGITCSEAGGEYIYTFQTVEFDSYEAIAVKFADSSATLRLVGKSTIDNGYTENGDTYVIYAEGDLTISGGGTLEANCATSCDDESAAIYVEGDLTIESGEIHATAGDSNGGAMGIASMGTLTVNGGKVYAFGGYGEVTSMGICAERKLIITDGQVYAQTNSSPLGTAVLAYNVEITGGSLEADATMSRDSYALVWGGGNGYSSITGGTVTLRAFTAVSARMLDGSFTVKSLGTVASGGKSAMQVTAGPHPDGAGAKPLSDWKGDCSDKIDDYLYMVLSPKSGTATPPASDEIDYTLIFSEEMIYKDNGHDMVELSSDELKTLGISIRVDGENQYTYIFTYVEFTTTADTALLFVRSVATVQLRGNNTVTALGNGTDSTCGIRTDSGDLLLTGDGSLTVTAGAAISGSSYGIQVRGTLTVSGAQIKAIGGKASGSSCGVSYSTGLTLEGGSLTAISDQAALSDGLNSYAGKANIMGGKLVAMGCPDVENSNGISTYGSVTVTGGVVILQGTRYAIAPYVGLTTLDKSGVNQVQTILGSADYAGAGAAELSGWKGDGSDETFPYKYLKLECAHVHQGVAHSGSPADCSTETDGEKDYYLCDCGEKFYDQACTQPVEKDADLVIPWSHTGGEANCSAKAKCTACGKEYGQPDQTNHTKIDFQYEVGEKGTHTKRYACCGAVVSTDPCTYGEEDACTLCGQKKEGADTPVKPPQTGTTDDPADPTDPDSDPDKDATDADGGDGEGSPLWLILVIAGAVLLAAGGVLCVSLLKKKKPSAPQE